MLPPVDKIVLHADMAGLTGIHFSAFEESWFYQTWVDLSTHSSEKEI
jgi:hypothetical protein